MNREQRWTIGKIIKQPSGGIIENFYFVDMMFFCLCSPSNVVNCQCVYAIFTPILRGAVEAVIVQTNLSGSVGQNLDMPLKVMS